MAKRRNIAGNFYTENIEDINVHVQGAYIFHTKVYYYGHESVHRKF